MPFYTRQKVNDDVIENMQGPSRMLVQMKSLLSVPGETKRKKVAGPARCGLRCKVTDDQPEPSALRRLKVELWSKV